MDSDFYTVSEAMKLLKVSRQTIYNWMRSGELHVVRVGRTGKMIRIPKDSLENMLHSRNERTNELAATSSS